jgi:hypothetical protein
MALDNAVATRSILIDKTEFAAFAKEFARSLDLHPLFRLHSTAITFMLTVCDKKDATF